MKKIIVSIMLIFTLCTSAFAVPLLAIPPVYMYASAAIHTAAIALGVYFTAKAANANINQSTGAVTKPTAVAWIDLTLPTPALVEKNVQTKMTADQLKLLATSNPTKYPLTNALFATPPAAIPVPTGVIPDGTVVTLDGQNYRVSGYATGGFVGCAANPTYIFLGMVTQLIPSGTPNPDLCPGSTNYAEGSSRRMYNTQNVTPFVAPTTAAVTAALTQADIPGRVNSKYRSEIDAMIKDPNYVPTFTDDTTGLPFAIPTTGANADAVAYYNTNASSVAAAAASTAAGAAATAAVASSTAAAAAAVTAQTQATVAAQNSAAASAAATAAAASSAAATAKAAASGTAADAAAASAAGAASTAAAGRADIAAGYAALTAQAAAGAASAAAGAASAAAGAAAQEAANLKSQGDDQKNAAITAPATGAAYGDGTNFDFGARFSTFMSDMKTSGLFSLPGQLLGNIPTGGQSDFNVSFGRMGSTRFDLADYGPAIGIMRTLTLIVFSVAGFRIVTLKGGSG